MSRTPSRRRRTPRSVGDPVEPPEATSPEQARAIEEVRTVADLRWPLWAASHDLDPATELVFSAPRVTLVGERPETYHHVAVLRFTFTHDGVAYRGFARGPLGSSSFVVTQAPPEPEDPAPHRWWRRHR